MEKLILRATFAFFGGLMVFALLSFASLAGLDWEPAAACARFMFAAS